MWKPIFLVVFAVAVVGSGTPQVQSQSTVANVADWSTQVRQITFGPKHTFFGYIGHVRTIPWNQSGRYVLALQSSFQERMPLPTDAAEIVLLDTKNGFRSEAIDSTHAWNFQQGTMMYWNPLAPETQFFFNDRNPETQEVFCVLYDVDSRKRIAEFRYPNSSIGNGGVAQRGGWFLGINYGRLARLRPVTGYPGVVDWSSKHKHPEHDGVFKVDTETRQRQLIVSFKQMANAIVSRRPDVADKDLFINHTLWSRNDRRIYFYLRGDFEVQGKRFDIPFTMNADGTQLTPLALHIGGHPEWMSDSVLIGSYDKKQVLYDVEQQKIVGTIGSTETIPNPGGDIALSPNGEWFVNGYGTQGKNYYNLIRLSDGAWIRTSGVDQGGYITGELRIDSSPLWNRDSNQLLVCGIAPDSNRTRQLYLISIVSK